MHRLCLFLLCAASMEGIMGSQLPSNSSQEVVRQDVSIEVDASGAVRDQSKAAEHIKTESDDSLTNVRVQTDEKVVDDKEVASTSMITKEDFRAPSNVDEPLIIVYETKDVRSKQFDMPSEHVFNLASQLSNLKYPAMLIGSGEEWKGWGSKVASVLAELKTLKPNQLVVISDSRDVLMNSVKDSKDIFTTEFMKIEKNHYNAVVVNAEADCCVAAMARSGSPGSLIDEEGNRVGEACSSGQPGCLHPGQQANKGWEKFFRKLAAKKGYGALPFQFLNAGLLAGRAKNVIRVFEFIQAKPTEDDQALLSEALYRQPDSIVLDYEQRLFGTNRWMQGLEDGCLYDWQADKTDKASAFWRNRVTNSDPLFIHTSGRFWECYMKLAQNLNVTTALTTADSEDLAEEQYGQYGGKKKKKKGTCNIMTLPLTFADCVKKCPFIKKRTSTKTKDNGQGYDGVFWPEWLACVISKSL